MPDKKTPNPRSRQQQNSMVMFLYGELGNRLPGWAQALAASGMRIFCRKPLAGSEQTRSSIASIGALCAELQAAAPGQPALLLRLPLALDQAFVREAQQLLALDDAPLVLGTLGNSEPELNPFAGLGTGNGLESHTGQASALVAWLADRQMHETPHWPAHCAALNVAAIEALAASGAGPNDAAAVVRAAGGTLRVPEWWFVHDPQQPLAQAPRLDPHEEPRPLAWGALRQRLRGWLQLPAAACPPASLRQKGATLHISHSWGGGVAVWVKSYIEASSRELSLQLLSESPQTGAGAGQRLSLYLGNELRSPLASWWLQPPIQAADDHNSQYRELLDEIRARFAVQRVLVSSLIGHGLDALRTGLPTVQVLHDHFPAWPLLSVHPSSYHSSLPAALADPRASEQFGVTSEAHWQPLAQAYQQALTGVELVAPSQSVIDIQRGLLPGWSTLPVTLIPHGLPPLPGARPVAARPRPDGRLRLLIPGRVQSGKGSDLLAAALPELTRHAQVYLLGTGKGGERFFGQAGVHVVLNYQHQQLAELVNDIGPHLAALLSVVPETYSYTLSEMQALGIPVVATRLGSFAERISDGEDGWLVEPDAAALVERIAAIAARPDCLAAAREALAGRRPITTQDMLARYQPLFGKPAQAALPVRQANPGLAAAQEASYRDLELRGQLAIETTKVVVEGLQATIEQRTHWALSEQQQRETWVASLKQELEDVQAQLQQATAQLASLQAGLNERNAHIAALDEEITGLQGQLADLVTAADELRAQLQQRDRHIAQRDEEITSLNGQLTSLVEAGNELRAELNQRALHIEGLDQQLVDSALQNQQLTQQLDASTQQNEQLGHELQLAQLARQQSEQQLAERQAQLEQSAAALKQQQADYASLLNSRSWRLTMPLRASRRLAANFMRVQGWNPLRWPLLLSQTARTVATGGWGSALERMQRAQPAGYTPPAASAEYQATEPGEDTLLPAELPVSEQPLVSIIIPVYNHLEHTAACLLSLTETHCDTPFEVIVVDDHSSDDSAARLPAVKGLRYQRNEQNMGFIHTCNNGSANARGQYVLFLNNDTQVRDGWLDKLVEVFEARPDAGLVGSRLVYPDGTLQECGGMVFKDGSGWNYGRGDNPDKPEYQYLREVDYCSGACVLLRRALFEELGGFDTHYAPAYYEDTDLAFKVRAAGFKVYVQPAATVVHFEGISSGTDIQSGTKRYQAVNREKFLQRWQQALQLQPDPIQDPGDQAAVRAARDHRLRGRVLVVDAYTPEPDQDSGSVRLAYLMKCLLDLGYGVSFFPDNRAWAGRYTRALQQAGVQAWYDPWLGAPADFLRVHGSDFDHIIVSRHYIASHYLEPVRKYAPQARFIFDTVDLHYLREQRHAELEDSLTLRQTARQTRRSELAVINAADATIVVSPVEVAVLAEEAPKARVFVLSNIHEVHGSARGFAQRRDLYFVGGYQHPPNINAVEWFIRDIWPLIQPQLPGVSFHVVGSKAPDSLRAMAEQHAGQGVRFHGFVEDLAPFLDGCRLSVAPLRYGAGVKGKVNQSMSHGQPVVATTVAMEGLHAEHGRDALIADQAEAFASAVVQLYNDQATWERLSEHGLANVAQHFSLASARSAIDTMFTELQPAKDG
jgi:GT2 family glycosyltransferase/glycosyltransferase involved in cell wall biosynthesis